METGYRIRDRLQRSLGLTYKIVLPFERCYSALVRYLYCAILCIDAYVPWPELPYDCTLVYRRLNFYFCVTLHHKERTLLYAGPQMMRWNETGLLYRRSRGCTSDWCVRKYIAGHWSTRSDTSTYWSMDWGLSRKGAGSAKQWPSGTRHSCCLRVGNSKA